MECPFRRGGFPLSGSRRWPLGRSRRPRPRARRVGRVQRRAGWRAAVLRRPGDASVVRLDAHRRAGAGARTAPRAAPARRRAPARPSPRAGGRPAREAGAGRGLAQQRQQDELDEQVAVGDHQRPADHWVGALTQVAPAVFESTGTAGAHRRNTPPRSPSLRCTSGTRAPTVSRPAATRARTPGRGTTGEHLHGRNDTRLGQPAHLSPSRDTPTRWPCGGAERGRLCGWTRRWSISTTCRTWNRQPRTARVLSSHAHQPQASRPLSYPRALSCMCCCHSPPDRSSPSAASRAARPSVFSLRDPDRPTPEDQPCSSTTATSTPTIARIDPRGPRFAAAVTLRGAHRRPARAAGPHWAAAARRPPCLRLRRRRPARPAPPALRLVLPPLRPPAAKDRPTSRTSVRRVSHRRSASASPCSRSPVRSPACRPVAAARAGRGAAAECGVRLRLGRELYLLGARLLLGAWEIPATGVQVGATLLVALGFGLYCRVTDGRVAPAVPVRDDLGVALAADARRGPRSSSSPPRGSVPCRPRAGSPSWSGRRALAVAISSTERGGAPRPPRSWEFYVPSRCSCWTVREQVRHRIVGAPAGRTLWALVNILAERRHRHDHSSRRVSRIRAEVRADAQRSRRWPASAHQRALTPGSRTR